MARGETFQFYYDMRAAAPAGARVDVLNINTRLNASSQPAQEPLACLRENRGSFTGRTQLYDPATPSRCLPGA